MAEKKDILFEVKAGKSDKVLVWAERKLGQVRIFANDSERGEVDLGHIEDVWRQNDNAQAELRHVRDILHLSADDDLAVTVGLIKTKSEDLLELISGKRVKK